MRGAHVVASESWLGGRLVGSHAFFGDTPSEAQARYQHYMRARELARTARTGSSRTSSTLGEPPSTLGAADPFAQADADVQSMAATIAAADEAVANDLASVTAQLAGGGAFADAIATYQSAGAFGVNTVAADVDGAGVPSVTEPLTSQAATLNATLAQLPTNAQDNYEALATANAAKSLAQTMLQYYSDAIAQGRAALGAPAPPPPTPTKPPAPQPQPAPPPGTGPAPATSSGSSDDSFPSWPAALLLGGVVGIGIIVGTRLL